MVIGGGIISFSWAGGPVSATTVASLGSDRVCTAFLELLWPCCSLNINLIPSCFDTMWDWSDLLVANSRRQPEHLKGKILKRGWSKKNKHVFTFFFGESCQFVPTWNVQSWCAVLSGPSFWPSCHMFCRSTHSWGGVNSCVCSISRHPGSPNCKIWSPKKKQKNP